MRVFEVSYTRRKNLGDYQHEEVSLKAEVSEGEDFDDVLDCLKHKTELFLGLKKDGATKTPDEVNLKVAETPKETAAKEETKKATVTKKTRKSVAKKEEKTDETPVIITLDDLKEAAKKVYKLRGKPVYEAIMEKLGVAKTDAIDEADYPKAMAEFDKAASEK